MSNEIYFIDSGRPEFNIQEPKIERSKFKIIKNKIFKKTQEWSLQSTRYFDKRLELI